jgi:hypothetical protein
MVFWANGLKNFARGPSQIHEFDVKSIRPWNIIHKLPLRIPCQVFIVSISLVPYAFKLCVKWTYTSIHLFLSSRIFYFKGHKLSSFRVKRPNWKGKLCHIHLSFSPPLLSRWGASQVFFCLAISQFDWAITILKKESIEAPQNRRFYFEV